MSARAKVYVGNLDPERPPREAELDKMFSYYGPLLSVWTAKMPPGFAFVQFEDERDADDACRGLNGTVLHGLRLKVQIADPPRRDRDDFYDRRRPPPPRRDYYNDRQPPPRRNSRGPRDNYSGRSSDRPSRDNYGDRSSDRSPRGDSYGGDRSSDRLNDNYDTKNRRPCFECGEYDHYSNQCPRRRCSRSREREAGVGNRSPDRFYDEQVTSKDFRRRSRSRSR